MYCRMCHYDLRGQTTPRCPECNTSFSFEDPDTYIEQLITVGQKLQLFLSALVICIFRLLMIILMMASHFAYPDLEGCRAYPTMGFTIDNLMAIAAEWRRQSQSEQITCKFDAKTARSHLSRRVSPTGDFADMSGQRRTERNVQKYGFKAAAPAFFGMLLGLTCRASTRTLLLWVAGLFFALGAGSCAFSTPIAKLCHPGSHAFLDDFTYLDPPFVKFHDGPLAVEIVALEKGTVRTKYKIVATSTGLVTYLGESQASELLRSIAPQHQRCNIPAP